MADDRDDDDRDDAKTRVCGYHGTASPRMSLPGRVNLGVPVIDLTDPRKPKPTAYLQTVVDARPVGVAEGQRTPADPGRRQRPERRTAGRRSTSTISRAIAVHPQLLASAPVGTGTDGGLVHKVIGHEGSWAPDGLTYYGGDLERRAVLRGRYHGSEPAEAALGLDARHCQRPRPLDQRRRQARLLRDRSGFGAGLTDPNVPAEQRPADLRPVGHPGAQAQSAGQADQHAAVEGRLGRPAHDPGEDQGQAVHGVRRRRRAPADSPPPRSTRRPARPACRRIPMARIIDISDEKNPKIVSQADARDARPGQLRRCSPDVVGLSTLHLRQPLLQRRQQEERHHARLRLLQLGHPGVRHPRPAAAEGDRVLQPGGAPRLRARARTTTAPAAGSPGTRTGALPRSTWTRRQARSGAPARTMAYWC